MSCGAAELRELPAGDVGREPATVGGDGDALTALGADDERLAHDRSPLTASCSAHGSSTFMARWRFTQRCAHDMQ